MPSVSRPGAIGPSTSNKFLIAQRGRERRKLRRDVFGVLSSRRGDDTNRRIFQSRRYGRAHTATERLVHVPVTGVRYV